MSRLRAIAAAAAAAAVLLAPAAGLGDEPAPRVSIEFGDYSPATIDVLAGETVDWTNDSERKHTVTDDGGAYDSGVVFPGDSFHARFDKPGAFPYHCRLHPYIRGAVDVWTLLLDRPPASAQAGQPFPLSGRADLPADATVSVEGDNGSGFHPVAKTTVGPDSITVRARRGRHSSVVNILVTPAAPRATVVLQLHLRERFGWWPVAQAKLDKHSRARFVVRLRRAVSARARLTLPDGATPLATSSLVRVGPPRRR